MLQIHYFYFLLFLNAINCIDYNPNNKLLCKKCGHELTKRSDYCPIESESANIIGFDYDINTNAYIYRISDNFVYF